MKSTDALMLVALGLIGCKQPEIAPGGGHQCLGESIVGIVPRDWGNEVILNWFDAHP